MVNKLRVKLLTLALQLRGKARHDGLLCRRACLYGSGSKLRYVYLPLKLRAAHKLLGVTKLALRGRCLRATEARKVKPLQVKSLRACACKAEHSIIGASASVAKSATTDALTNPTNSREI